jgi:hypothetical protein
LSAINAKSVQVGFLKEAKVANGSSLNEVENGEENFAFCQIAHSKII